MTTQKTIIQIGNEVIELTGDDLAAFEAQRALDLAEANSRKSEADAKAAARENALAKLAALGLTAEEIGAL